MSATIDARAVPRFPAGVRLQHDRAREQWVLLAPERVVELDEIAHAVLARVDGTADIAAIVDALAAEYGADAEQVRGDVLELFANLLDKRMLAVAAPAS
ncbi:coenzyme PQQ synthesis protein D [Lysobacter antibioticus]|uniref:Coenzyme PQQ biosynthesis protein PqqD n=1 Tax=Lysobacter antibioticus TaxID=84531 RepID=A0A0S2E0L8_LYSAN|nr:pyrroloquinoline quinone biosynthesis peptide chaperone PqqD [Lysobacter antibioticus]ALN64225.1 coenzyme PQQ synthesis protein D [Lysobacter antibioticus]ALN82019.1 coenzyme PQQ biosynthesis protein PqqD [Lysobacter antibioticus]